MPVALGAGAATDIKLGTTQIQKAYLGTTLLWSAGAVPSEPLLPSTVPISGAVQVMFRVPTSNGGSAITGYVAQWRTTAGPGSWNLFTSIAGVLPGVEVTGLSNGTSYDFRAAAVNANGTGTYSSIVTATPNVQSTLSLDFTETDGVYTKLPNYDPATLGSHLVVSNHLSTVNDVRLHGGIIKHGVNVSGDWQIDFDCHAPTGTGDGGAQVALLDATFTGWAIFAGNATHIANYTSGSHLNRTNETRTLDDSHITFTRRASDGLMQCFLDGVLQPNSFTDLTRVAGLYLIVWNESNNSPTYETTMDNLVLRDTIIGPPIGLTWTGTPATVTVTATSGTWSRPTGFKANLGTQVATTSGTTLVITTTTAVTVGEVIVVRVAADNFGTAQTQPTFTCADSASNTYTTHAQRATNATAAAGVAGAIIVAKATTALAAGGTITITLSNSVAARAAYAESFTDYDNTLRASTMVTAAGSSTTPAVTSGSVTSGDLVLAATAVEHNTAVTYDTDTANGTWSTAYNLVNAAGGTANTRVQITGQHKVTTGTATQAYNNTIATGDWVAMILALEPATAAVAQTWTASTATATAVGASGTWSVAGTFDPLTAIPWSAAFWAEDPAVTAPANGAVLPTTWNQPGSYTTGEWVRVGSPTFISSWTGGKPAVNFAQGHRLTADFSASLVASITFVIVGETTTTESDLTDSADTFAGSGTRRMVFDRVGGLWRVYRGNSVSAATGNASPHLFIVRCFNDGADSVTVDGTAVLSAQSFGNNTSVGVGLGSTDTNTDHVTSKLAFFGIVTGELTTLQRSDLLTWAQSHYGI